MVFRMEYIKTNAKISARMNNLIQNLRFRRQNNWIIPEYNGESEEYYDANKILYYTKLINIY